MFVSLTPSYFNIKFYIYENKFNLLAFKKIFSIYVN